MNADRKAALFGYTLFGIPAVAIGCLAIALTGPTADPPDSTAPPAEQVHESCYDGLPSKGDECWERIKQKYEDDMATWSPSATPSPTVYTPPTLTLPFPSPPPGAPAAGSICRDGSLSQSTGRGTCSWHGGIAP